MDLESKFTVHLIAHEGLEIRHPLLDDCVGPIELDRRLTLSNALSRIRLLLDAQRRGRFGQRIGRLHNISSTLQMV